MNIQRICGSPLLKRISLWVGGVCVCALVCVTHVCVRVVRMHVCVIRVYVRLGTRCESFEGPLGASNDKNAFGPSRAPRFNIKYDSPFFSEPFRAFPLIDFRLIIKINKI